MLSLTAPPKFMKGSAYGLTKSYLEFSIEPQGDVDLEQYLEMCSAFDAAFGEPFMERPASREDTDLCVCILKSISQLAEKTYQHVELQIYPMRGQEKFPTRRRFRVVCPEYFKVHFTSLLQLMLSATKTHLETEKRTQPHWRAALENGRLNAILNQISAGPPSIITRHIVRAALNRNIPCTQLDGDVWRLGIGSESKLLFNSFTENSSAMGANLVRDKLAMAKLLTRNGLPNLGGFKVDSSDKAVAVAEKIGYPVVVKPLSLDGGAGVGVNLASSEDVRKQVEKTTKLQKQMLVQKHANGKDYRFIIANNRVLAVVERIPGGVTGDGINTIEALVAKVNEHPMRGNARHLPLHTLTIDDEAKDMMSKAGVTANSILEAGRFLALRGTANVATGGTPIDVLSTVHRDNLALALEATKTFRLDLAGVDLILPDARRSFRETGGWVCEVNAQPVLGYSTTAHIYPMIVQGLVPGTGRIPISMIVTQPEAPLLDQFLTSLLMKNSGLGIAHRGQINLGTRYLSKSFGNCYDDLEVLFSNQDCRHVICVVDHPNYIKFGLPIDRFDRLSLWEADHHDDKINSNLAAVLKILRPYARQIIRTAEHQQSTLSEQLPDFDFHVVQDDALEAHLLSKVEAD